MGNIGVWAPFVFHLSLSARCRGGEGKSSQVRTGCIWGSPFMARATGFVHFEPPQGFLASHRPSRAWAAACGPVQGCRATGWAWWARSQRTLSHECGGCLRGGKQAALELLKRGHGSHFSAWPRVVGSWFFFFFFLCGFHCNGRFSMNWAAPVTSSLTQTVNLGPNHSEPFNICQPLPHQW